MRAGGEGVQGLTTVVWVWTVTVSQILTDRSKWEVTYEHESHS